MNYISNKKCNCCYCVDKSYASIFCKTSTHPKHTLEELTNMVYELVKENRKLKTEFEFVRKKDMRVIRRRIVDYLSQPENKCTINYKDWLEEYVNFDKSIEDLLHNTIFDLIKKRIKSIITNVKQNNNNAYETFPFRAFSEKHNVLYFYNSTPGTWVELSDSKDRNRIMEFMFKTICSSYNALFINWNIEQIQNRITTETNEYESDNSNSNNDKEYINKINKKKEKNNSPIHLCSLYAERINSNRVTNEKNFYELYKFIYNELHEPLRVSTVIYE